MVRFAAVPPALASASLSLLMRRSHRTTAALATEATQRWQPHLPPSGCATGESDAFRLPVSIDKIGTSHALGPTVMLKTTERNRRKAICASLIASTIVTVDCTGEDCACAVGQDPDSPSSAPLPANDDSISFAEMPTGDGVVYSLAPVITSLPVDPTISVANLPADLAIEDVLIDAVSQPDQLVDLDDADASEVSPRLTRAKKRSASNQNRSSRGGGKGLPDIITEEVIALPDTEHFGPAIVVSKADEHAMASRPVLQDDYVAFGVNGR